ncbi:MAG: hypothetical protein Q7S36_00290 [Candidatus Liptonbacteria bacterium]|nr:hypothetical protein [Candidatus Liptonbacteria bacterium]
MLTFVIANLFLISLAAILFLVVRTLPRIENPEEVIKQSPLERWVTSGVPEKLDATINVFLAKTLRKTKVLVLKVDNFVTAQLKRVVHENGNGKPKPDFKEINGVPPGGDQSTNGGGNGTATQ